MNNLNIGIIGAGNMGQKHIQLCKEIKNINLVGFFDIDHKKAKEISEQLDTPFFSEINDLLKKIDAVIICVPTSFHFKYGILCAKKQKHILMEKPICKTPDEAKKLIDLCKENKIILQVGHIERFNPVIDELSKILKDEEIISLEFRRLSPYTNRISDTDVIHDLMIHDIDIMHYIITSSIKNIFAQGQSIYSHESIDYAQALIEYENHILVSLTASRITEEKIRELVIHTKNTYIDVDFLKRSITISRYSHINNQKKYSLDGIVENIYIPDKNPLKNEIVSFVTSIQMNKSPFVDGNDGLNNLITANKILSKIKKCKISIL
ncbi:Gfo/Idh/MocA family protein [Inediibacterium massiliense]|uniref:Gfo/Idh/MocA family protein n=1 Tax=Inediibacterium massiliense TaxID=1658111 RepID=UPI0006B52A93|nr:Gfo/Idh/MocA family oxidoreductase [Inediibacterium massiliense]